MSFIKKDRVISFVGGAVLTTLGAFAVKNGCARKAAVKVMSCGMKAQESATRGFETMKEDAQDIVQESREKARVEAEKDAE